MKTTNTLAEARKIDADAKLVDDRNQLLDRITDFLAVRNESENGGWAKVTEQDMVDLRNIFYDIIDIKFAEDCDGDVPIDCKIINRTEEEPMHFRAVRYDRADSNLEELLERLYQHGANFSTAHRCLDSAIQSIRLLQANKAKKECTPDPESSVSDSQKPEQEV